MAKKKEYRSLKISDPIHIKVKLIWKKSLFDFFVSRATHTYPFTRKKE